ncbi:Monoacylglycerol lipase abhd6-B [Holothuria leucospilota]|uniref:acylglycerol lipase n=1 Tax=Holothuria leucospilota TaxID=206669 RepID=A0A9Q1HIU2_HOLLE|nr:Monoacylglycerol lipase abhd6-B [Holothuria leucospilota]
MLDYLACCLELLLIFIRKPENQRWLFIASPVVLLVGFVMKSLLYFVFIQVFFLFILTYWRPAWIMDFSNWTNLRKNNFVVKYLQVGDFTFCYAERGKPSDSSSSILFLHGLSASKEMWFPMVTAIPSDRHVVLLDMPGHGKSTQKIDFSYSFMNQASRVAQFVIASGLGTKPFHLIGISMGGGVAIAYAATHPRDVSKLSLLCPAGCADWDKADYMQDVKKGLITTGAGMMPINFREQEKVFPYLFYMTGKKIPSLHGNEKSDYMKDIESGRIVTDSGKMPLNAEEQHKAFRYMFYMPKGFKLPRMYSWLAFEITKSKRPIHGKVSNDLEADVNNKALHKYFPKITSPTLVLWGKHDRLVHPSGADVLKAALPKCEVHMLHKCGHTISYDRPFKALKLILKFDES